MIPILNLTRQFEQIGREITEAIAQVAASGHYILGPNVTAFESEMARFLGVKHAIGCASGTDALILACKALKIRPGDEVITTSFSYIATSEAIVHGGGRPVFCDIDPVTFNIDVAHLAKLITPRTRAIIPVHLYGLPANMEAIMALAKQHGLAVIEDCAQAIDAEYRGVKVGAIGDIGCFSFFPTKNLGALGDGGLVTTNDDQLADRLRMLRVHAARTRYDHEEAGLNSRLDEIQAAALRIKLKYLRGFNQRRQEIAACYTQRLSALGSYLITPSVPEGCSHVFHQYTVRLNTTHPEHRNQVQEALKEKGVMSMIYYPIPLYAQTTHADLGCNPADFPVSEQLRHQVFSLPMFPELTEAEIETVTNAVKDVVPAVLGSVPVGAQPL